MTTDPDLDRQLWTASGVRDADVPVLPVSFREHLKQVRDEPASVVALRQLAGEARRPGTGARAWSQRRRSWRPVAALAALGTLAAASLSLLLQPGSDQAGPLPGGPSTREVLTLAGYSPTPEQPSDQRTVQIAAACASAVGGAVTELDPTFDSDTADGVLTEVRGEFGLDIFAGQRFLGLCLTHAEAVGGEVVLGVTAEPNSSPMGTRALSADLSTTAELDFGTGPQPYRATIGRVASDVVSVEVQLSDGAVITATVSNGWWAAWWPDANDATASAVAVVDDGSVFESDLG